MVLSRPATRLRRGLSSLETCFLCQPRQLTPLLRENNTAGLLTVASWHPRSTKLSIQNRHYAAPKLDVQRLRRDVDTRARLGFYTLSKQQGALGPLEPHTADSIYKDFITQKDKIDHGSNVLRLAKKYKVGLDDITSLGIATFKIPDLSDPVKRAQLPPSPHKTISGLLLQGCAMAEDPFAVVHILTAVYLAQSSPNTIAKDIARLFSKSEIARYRTTLDAVTQISQKIALGPDALTLKGLFLEQEGEKHKAKELYELAITRSGVKYAPDSRHPMQLPLITPWNALGYLLKSDKDPSVQAEAKKYFEMGALKGDDPLSCYELAEFEPKASTKWLQYTSKAAASGHKQAVINLANFYQEVAVEDSPILTDSSMRNALNWLLKWRPGSAAALAREWLQVASNIGHKPSMLQLADYHDSTGNPERAKEYLRQMLEPPSTANQSEEWPQLVQLARKRLAGIR